MPDEPILGQFYSVNVTWAAYVIRLSPVGDHQLSIC